ncbi:MAG: transporter substrate-binding domain-containing protein [Synergistaceae bacterium]|nr:transporter substrate-binding domain-containing protein [Synergistaceae bacterium]
MKKFLSVVLVLLLMAGTSYGLEKKVIKLGLLSKLNTTEEQFMETWRKTFAPKNENLEIVIKFYDNLNAMQMALNVNDINEMILPDFTADYVMNMDKSYRSSLVLRSKGMGLAFGFSAENKHLQMQFNEALTALISDWTLSALEGIYIASPGMTEPEPIEFRNFEGAEEIRIAVTGDLPPIDYIAADGRPAGFSTAVLSEIGRYLKKNIKLINIEAGARTAALTSGRVDVVFWYEIDTTKEVQPDVPEGIILSQPYYEWDRFVHLVKVRDEDKKTKGWDPSSWWSVRDVINLHDTGAQ